MPPRKTSPGSAPEENSGEPPKPIAPSKGRPVETSGGEPPAAKSRRASPPPPEPPFMDPVAAAAIAANAVGDVDLLAVWPSPKGPDGHLVLGGLQVQVGQGAEALRSYERARGSAFDLQARLGAIHGLLAEGDQAAALGAAREVVQEYPSCLYGWILVARLEAGQGNMEAALEAVKDALGMKPAWEELWNLRGVLLGALDRWEEAQEAFLKATALRDGYAIAWNNLGAALLRLGDPEGSIKALSRALTVEPRYPEALCNLGNALLAKGEAEKALKALKGATVLSDAPGIHQSLAAVLEGQGRYQAALEKYEEILEGDPEYEPAQQGKARVQTLAATPPS